MTAHTLNKLVKQARPLKTKSKFMKNKLPSLRLPAVLLASLFLTQLARPATVTWSGVDALALVNTNWSDASNWSGGTPAPANSILFTNLGTAAAVSNIDNIVDVNTTNLALKYANTTGFHTTLIKPGVTLTVTNTGSGNLVFVGTGTDSGASQIVDVTITGAGGHLAVSSTNVGSLMVVQQGAGASGSHTAILDLSGLDTFNLTAGRLLLAGAPLSGGGPSNYLSGTLFLAKTNSIRLNGTAAPTMNVGDAVSNGGTTYAYLGQTNAIYADSITIARLKATATMAFNPALLGNNPVLLLNGNANSRVNALAIGDFSSQTSASTSTTTGNVDLSAGTVNALVNTCYLGRGQASTGAGTTTGTLTIGAGVFNVNTLYAAYVSTATAAGRVTGTVNVTNGTLVVMTNLILGYNPGASATAAATLNISNGVVYANNITSSNGAVTSAINMTGGTLVVSNTAGTPSIPIGALSLGSATLQITAGSAAANVVASSLDLIDSASVVNVSSLPVLFGYPTTLPLISYASLAEGSTINLAPYPEPTRVTFPTTSPTRSGWWSPTDPPRPRRMNGAAA